MTNVVSSVADMMESFTIRIHSEAGPGRHPIVLFLRVYDLLVVGLYARMMGREGEDDEYLSMSGPVGSKLERLLMTGLLVRPRPLENE